MTKTKTVEINSWKTLKNVVRSIPIEESAYVREADLSLQRRGRQLFGICPFHTDERRGNFALGGPHNGYKCFACGASGDVINLIMQIDDLSFKEALVKIAVELDILTTEEAANFKEGKSSTFVKVQSNKSAKTPYVKLDEEQIERRNIVYSLLAEGNAIINPIAEEFGLEKQNRLSKEHLKHLKEERKLTDKEIKEVGFFTLESSYSYLWALYYRLLSEKNCPPNILNVPGFYRLKNGLTIDNMNYPDGRSFNFESNHLEKQYYWFFDPIDALGIPIRDENGHMIAIQLRPDDKESGGKYIWFSSTYADGAHGKIDGISAGAQQDICYPENWKNPHLYITEGKFKSLAITKLFRSASISLQGVNTYTGVGTKVALLDKYHKNGVENVLVAFDGDLSFNNAVMKAVSDMVNKELKEYNVHIVVWDYLFGKGIDDLIQNGHGNAMKRITPTELNHIRKYLKEQCPIKKKSTKEEREQIKRKREELFYKWLKEIHPDTKLHSSRLN